MTGTKIRRRQDKRLERRREKNQNQSGPSSKRQRTESRVAQASTSTGVLRSQAQIQTAMILTMKIQS